MTLHEPNFDFESFAKHLAEQSNEAITLQAALDMWACRNDDDRAIQEAIDSFEAGERGRPADEVMADLRKKLDRQFQT